MAFSFPVFPSKQNYLSPNKCTQNQLLSYHTLNERSSQAADIKYNPSKAFNELSESRKERVGLDKYKME